MNKQKTNIMTPEEFVEMVAVAEKRKLRPVDGYLFRRANTMQGDYTSCKSWNNHV